MKIKKAATALLILALCFSLVSCGASGKKLKAGKTTILKISEGEGMLTCSFTAKAAGEYTFTYEAETNVLINAYTDEEMTQSYGHTYEGSEVCFSLPLEEKQTVYLSLAYSTDTSDKAKITVNEYTQDDVLDINYGHPSALALDTAKSIDNNKAGFPRVFSYTPASNGTFVFSCIGESPVQVRFYADPWCTEELESINNTQYPNERYISSFDTQFCAVRTMAAEESVYFTVSSDEENCMNEVSVKAATSIPDPQSAIEQFIYLTKEKAWHPFLLLQNNPESSFKAGFQSSAYVPMFAKAVTSYDTASGEVGNGKDISDYISKNELYLLDGSYSIFTCSDVQSAMDALWGAGRVDASKFSDAYSEKYGTAYSTLSTSKLYIFNLNGSSDDGTKAYYKVIDAHTEGKATIVTVIGVTVSSSNKVYDIACNLGADNYLGKSTSRKFTTVEEYLSDLGKTEADLELVDFIFFSTKDGIKLWGASISGDVNLPAIPSGNTTLPDVVPTSFDEQHSGILTQNTKMRKGPSADYDTIMTIPEGTEVRYYAAEGDWYYVCYMGRYGWITLG